MTACQVQQKTLLVTALVLTLTVMIESGYVDLYRDAYFENKIMRVKGVVADVCYTFKCGQLDTSSLDNSVTSVKWHDLPEMSNYFTDKETIIRFYTDQSCKGSDNWWKVKTQSKHNMYFPENFRLDNINDAISSFKVVQAGGDAGELYACPPRESSAVTNATTNE